MKLLQLSYIHRIPEFKADPNFPPGPKNIPPNFENELDFFRLFWDDYIINTFVTNTKTSIKTSKQPTAKPANKFELFKFIAYIIFMGIVSMPTMKDPFFKKPLGGLPFVMRLFFFYRFKFIFLRYSIYSYGGL